MTILKGLVPIDTFRVKIGKNSGTKRLENDKKTPEGAYYICEKTKKSRFYRAMRINYPSIKDANWGFRYGLISKEQRDSIAMSIHNWEIPLQNTRLGSNICLHGPLRSRKKIEDVTFGCITTSKKTIYRLFSLCPLRTLVLIVP